MEERDEPCPMDNETAKPIPFVGHVKWQVLSVYFKARRGEGVAYKTIQGWQMMGMPYHQPSPHRTWFDPEVCWQWYLDRFTVERA